MNTNQYENVHSARDVLNYINQTGLINNPHLLKFITLSIHDFHENDLDWALKLTQRSFNNFLDRRVNKKSIREAIKIYKMSNYYSKTNPNSLWYFHRERIRHILEGGWRKTEIEQDIRNTHVFNIHLHIICECQYIPQPLLSVIWKSAVTKPYNGRTCNSEGIVDVQDVTNTDEDIKNVINYMAKEIPIARSDRFKHTRLYSTFGSWYNRN